MGDCVVRCLVHSHELLANVSCINYLKPASFHNAQWENHAIMEDTLLPCPYMFCSVAKINYIILFEHLNPSTLAYHINLIRCKFKSSCCRRLF